MQSIGLRAAQDFARIGLGLREGSDKLTRTLKYHFTTRVKLSGRCSALPRNGKRCAAADGFAWKALPANVGTSGVCAPD
jgi:hypothetical protein